MRAPQADKDSATTSKPDSREIGRALRTVYDKALEETIPPEMLDLLGRLD